MSPALQSHDHGDHTVPGNDGPAHVDGGSGVRTVVTAPPTAGRPHDGGALRGTFWALAEFFQAPGSRRLTSIFPAQEDKAGQGGCSGQQPEEARRTGPGWPAAWVRGPGVPTSGLRGAHSVSWGPLAVQSPLNTKAARAEGKLGGAWSEEVLPSGGSCPPRRVRGLDKAQAQELLCLGHSSVACAYVHTLSPPESLKRF